LPAAEIVNPVLGGAGHEEAGGREGSQGSEDGTAVKGGKLDSFKIQDLTSQYVSTDAKSSR
jgi:hypothetical protein